MPSSAGKKNAAEPSVEPAALRSWLKPLEPVETLEPAEAAAPAPPPAGRPAAEAPPRRAQEPASPGAPISFESFAPVPPLPQRPAAPAPALVQQGFVPTELPVPPALAEPQALVFLPAVGADRSRHSFPTRRSSD